ncbi:MAG: hypothetical protein Q7J10_06880 [Methanosarcinaceae archaeon]|nr:hypothetical protein [Methanosarcinaceae archaeon]
MTHVEIDSYELYHIGNKLNPAINFEKFKDDLELSLKDYGFSIIKEKHSFNITNITSEVICTKNNVKVELNYVAQALNVIGTNPSEVTSIFEEIISILPKMEYEIDSTITFYEVLAGILLKSSDKPVGKIGALINLNTKLFTDNDIPEINTIGFRIGGNEPSDNAFITLTIEPNPVNPNLKIAVKIQYRAEKDNIIEFHKGLDSKIQELFKPL